MEFDPSTQQLTQKQTLYTKGNKLFISDSSNTVKLFFRKVCLRGQYDQRKIFAVFQSIYEESDQTNVANLDRLQANYKILINSGKAKHKNFKNSSCIVRIFLRILYGKIKAPSKSDTDFYKSIKASYDKKARSAKALFSKYRKDYSKINKVKDYQEFFQVTLNNYLPSLMDKPFKEVSKNFLSFLNSTATLPHDELKETKNTLEEILNLFEKSQSADGCPVDLAEMIAKLKAAIIDIEIQEEVNDFQIEFNELLDEFETPYIFYSLTAFGELQVPNLSDFVKLINSHLPMEMKLTLKTADSMVNYTTVLKTISLLEIKDYIKNKIFTVGAFESYIRDNALQIRNKIKHLL